VHHVKKHETPTRVGGVTGGSVGLVVVGVSDMEAKIDAAMAKADKVEKKPLNANTDELASDVAAADSD
jgi:hypothetical protein